MKLSPEDLLKHREFVRALARRLVFDEDRAEDVVQETWLAALRSPPRDHSGLRAWLAVVARNVARRWARSKRRRDDREREAARPETVGSAEEAVARVQWHRRVVDEVLVLDEPYRSTVIRHFFEDLSPKQIAALEGVPASTVRVRLHRALDMLRGRLDSAAGGSRRAWAVALLPLAMPEKAAGGTAAAIALTVGGIVMRAKARTTLVLLAAGIVGTGLVVDRAMRSSTGPVARAGPRSASAGGGVADIHAQRPEGDRLVASDATERAAAAAAEPEGGVPLKDITEDVVRAYNRLPKLEGRVVGADGRGIAGARVVASQGGQRNRAEVATDAEGRFLFDGVRGTADLAFATFKGTRITSTDVPQLEGAGAGVELRFEGAAGHVVDGDGQPIVRGIVLARRPGSDEVVANAPVGPDGAFAFFGLESGPFILTYKTSVHGSEYEVVDGGLDVEEWRTDVVLRLATGATIEGAAFGAAGAPAPGVWIRATVGSVLTGAYTDQDGRFEIVGLVPGRDYRLTVWSRGFVPETRTVVAGERGVRFVLEPGLTATGRVVYADGKPVANRPLIVRTEVGRELAAYPVTDKEGRFEVSGLPDERIAIEFIDGKRWRCGSFQAGARDVVLTATGE